MAKRGSNQGPGPTPQPLIETSPVVAIELLESQVAKLKVLGPIDRDAIRDANRYLHADVAKVFGRESDEYMSFVHYDILEDDHLLRRDDGDDDLPWLPAEAVVKVSAGIARMVARVRRLIDRAKSLSNIKNTGAAMGLGMVDDHGKDFVLVKPDKRRIPSRGIHDVAKGRLVIEDMDLVIASGDTIEFVLPNKNVEVYDVMLVDHQGSGILEHYYVKIRHEHARPQLVAHHVVNNTDNSTTYNNSGTAGAIGENATVASSTVIGQATQWNGVDRDRLADELVKLRTALAAKAGEDDDAAAELGPVGEANKAIKAGDESGVIGAAKRFGTAVWGHVQAAGLTYLDFYLREKLGLPPPGHNG